MGYEQNDRQDSAAPVADHKPLNFLDIFHSRESGATNTAYDQKSNFAGLPTLRESQVQSLDCSAPLYATDTPAVVGKTPDVAAAPANKYEATVTGQVNELDSEAQFSAYTKDALQRDANRFPPVRNEEAGLTTYTIEQFGLSDRNVPKDQTAAEHYKRLVTITVPDDATSLKDCKFEYQDRQKIDRKEFDALVGSAQKRQTEQCASVGKEHKVNRPEDIAFYTHGIRTAEVSSDFQALALQLSSGHSVVNVDWKSRPPSEEHGIGLTEAYNAERAGAAQSYVRFEKAIDDSIKQIGANHTDMIAFSHGAMFDSRYLQHRKDSHAPLLNAVILTHPDVPVSTLPQPDKDGKFDPANRFYSSVAKETHVIGSAMDLAMTGAAYNDCKPCESQKLVDKWNHHNRQMEINARLGNGAKISRQLVEGCGGNYVLETIPADKKDVTKHFVNMSSISQLLNDPKLAKIATKD